MLKDRSNSSKDDKSTAGEEEEEEEEERWPNVLNEVPDKRLWPALNDTRRFKCQGCKTPFNPDLVNSTCFNAVNCSIPSSVNDSMWLSRRFNVCNAFKGAKACNDPVIKVFHLRHNFSNRTKGLNIFKGIRK